MENIILGEWGRMVQYFVRYFFHEIRARTHVVEVRFPYTVDGIFVVTFSLLWSSKKIMEGKSSHGGFS